MMKTGLILAAALAAGYLAFPHAREWLLASAPFLLALICPITMLGMMFMMKGSAGQQQACSEPELPAKEKARGQNASATAGSGG